MFHESYLTDIFIEKDKILLGEKIQIYHNHSINILFVWSFSSFVHLWVFEKTESKID